MFGLPRLLKTQKVYLPRVLGNIGRSWQIIIIPKNTTTKFVFKVESSNNFMGYFLIAFRVGL